MADVNRGGETGPEERPHHGADTIDSQRRLRWESIARGLSRLDVLQGPQHVEKPHGNDD